MRLCRFRDQQQSVVGLYYDTHVIGLRQAAQAHREATHQAVAIDDQVSLVDCLPPEGRFHAAAQQLDQFVQRHWQALETARRPIDQIQLQVPVPRPNKLFLLAGNYARHIEEGGGIAAEREETFPYVFMKPPSTTLTDPGQPIVIPAISPDTIDWEVELAVVIGRRVKGISEDQALSAVAGYTVINDVSNRQFRPNPGRKEREKDSFFDWLHGKWFDSFCPCGPCVVSAEAIKDPQQLELKLAVNGQLKQHSNTSHQIFPVAAVIAFISSFVTLEPGDLIATGTPAGVGNTTKTYLQPGDQVEASIEAIGTLKSPVVAESSAAR